MAKLMDFFSKHSSGINLVWLAGGFIGWTIAGVVAWNQAPGAAIGSYLLLSWALWLVVNGVPAWALNTILWVRRGISGSGLAS